MPTRSTASTSHYIGRIYDAALDAGQWDAVLRALAKEVRARGMMLLNVDYHDKQASVSSVVGFDARALEAYTSHWHYQDPARHLHEKVRPGTPVAAQHHFTRAAWERSEYFNGFSTQFDLYYQLGIKLADDPQRKAYIGSNRARSDGPFEPATIRLLAELGPHLVRAFQIGRLSARVADERALLSGLLRHADAGVIILDDLGRIYLTNQRADALLSAGDALATRGRRVILRERAGQRRLQQLIADCIGTANGAGKGAGACVVLPGDRSGESLVLQVTPLPLHDPGGRRCAAGIFIFTRTLTPRPDEPVLRALFGLTASEAHVAALIAQGLAPEAIAAEGNVSPHTVRAQLRAVFEKVGVHRQAELVAQVLSSPAAVAPLLRAEREA